MVARLPRWYAAAMTSRRRRTRLSRGAAAALAAAALTLAGSACGGGDGGSSLPGDILLTPVAGETRPANITIFDEPTSTPQAGAVNATATPLATGAAATLVDLMDAGLTATYRVRYRSSSDEGAGDSYIVYSKPPLLRIDTVPAGSDLPSSIVIIRAGGRSVSCTPDGGNWSCDEFQRLPGNPLLTLGPVIYPDASTLAETTVTEVHGREIAGEPTRCFFLAGPARGPDGYCLTAEGVVVLSFIEGANVEATEFSRDVSQDDFILPDS
jgi:hypothetical protein